jgi:hypothetical protein
MSDTPNLGLTYMSVGQSQKETTFNEALSRLDMFGDRIVLNRTTTAAPTSTEASTGAAYIIPSTAGGVWVGLTDQIAQYIGGAWEYYTPRKGWMVYVSTEDKYYAFQRGVSTGWVVTAL